MLLKDLIACTMSAEGRGQRQRQPSRKKAENEAPEEPATRRPHPIPPLQTSSVSATTTLAPTTQHQATKGQARKVEQQQKIAAKHGRFQESAIDRQREYQLNQQLFALSPVGRQEAGRRLACIDTAQLLKYTKDCTLVLKQSNISNDRMPSERDPSFELQGQILIALCIENQQLAENLSALFTCFSSLFCAPRWEGRSS
jgi:hypothetical protein